MAKPSLHGRVCCCSMYWRTMEIGAPPHEAAKYDGDHRAPRQYFLAMSGLSFLKSLLETPLRLFTRVEMATLGGYRTRRCTWSASPSISSRVASKSAHTLENMVRSLSIASPWHHGGAAYPSSGQGYLEISHGSRKKSDC